MRIVVWQKKFYDWMPLPRGTKATRRDYERNLVRDMADGTKRARVELDAPLGLTHTGVSLHEPELDDCMAHFKRVGQEKNRAQTAAWYLHEKTMPHKGHPDHFLKVEVHDEPDVEAFLNMYFNTPFVKDPVGVQAEIDGLHQAAIKHEIESRKAAELREIPLRAARLAADAAATKAFEEGVAAGMTEEAAHEKADAAHATVMATVAPEPSAGGAK